jgi:hypothetical protein
VPPHVATQRLAHLEAEATDVALMLCHGPTNPRRVKWAASAAQEGPQGQPTLQPRRMDYLRTKSRAFVA